MAWLHTDQHNSQHTMTLELEVET